MPQLNKLTGVVLFAFALAAGDGRAGAPATVPKKLTLPDSDVAVAMAAPILPARITGDCPSPDQCEFGTKWRTCQSVPVYRDAREGAPLMRTLKADEEFIALAGEIELIAPGEVEILVASTPAQTGGLALPKGLKLAVYGPMPRSRALYFDPSSGKGWSPPAASDAFWWDDKIAKLTRAPTMTWWLKVKLGNGKSGWLQLKSVPDLRNFPLFYHAEAIQTWDVERVRDDESPDCAGLLEIMDKWVGK